MECETYIIKVSEKEIVLDENIVKILNEYARTEFTLEKLAEILGFESWEEAYEFVKKVPAWIMWIPYTLWKVHIEKCKARNAKFKRIVIQ